MKWNDNDTKYILKRLLVYLIITGIIFFTGTKCAKAQIQSGFLGQYTQAGNNTSRVFYTITGYSKSFQPYTALVHGTTTTLFQNYGEGYVVFSLMVGPATSGANAVLSDVYIDTTGSDLFACDIGNMTTYVDNTKYNNSYTITCPVDFKNGSALEYIIVQRSGTTGEQAFWPSDLITFVGKEQADYSTINAAQQQTTQQVQNVFNQMMNEGTYTRNVISQSAAQAHIDSVNEQAAINNQTQAISDLNDFMSEDYQVPDDVGEFFDFSELFGAQDTDVIRGLLLFPFRIFAILLNAAENDTCITYSFGSLLGTNLSLPCIDYKQYIGNALYATIDIIFGLVIVFGTIRYFVYLFDFVFTLGLKGYSNISTTEVFK